MSAQCTLIADRTDDAVQLALGFIALSSLYCKWHFETPRRAAKVWFLDAMKQGTSALMVHVLNIVCAIATADNSEKPSGADECAFYFMNVVIDTTLGVYIAYLLLQIVTAVGVRYDWPALKHPGRYGDPPSLRIWTVQLLSWMLVLVVMKAIVAVAIFVFRTPLGLIGEVLFYPVHNYPKIELLIVMIGCPLVMNMVQFWIQDSFLKDHTDARSNGETLGLNGKIAAKYGSAEVQPTTRRELRNLFGLLAAKTEDVPHLQQPVKKTTITKIKNKGENAEGMYEVL